MHNPSCNALGWSKGRFYNNTAADGGALYLTVATTRNISGSGVYEHNMVGAMLSDSTWFQVDVPANPLGSITKHLQCLSAYILFTFGGQYQSCHGECAHV